MNNFAKAGMLTIALGAVFASADSNAELVVYGSAANAPGRCQAFTPGREQHHPQPCGRF